MIKKMYPILGILIILFILGVSGCGKKPAAAIPGDAKSVGLHGVELSAAYSGQTITFLCSGTPWVTPLLELIPQFEKATGIRVDVQQFVDTQLSNKIAISSSAGGKDIDVIYYRPLQESLLFIKNGWLADLSDFLDRSGGAYDYQDFFNAGREITANGGKIYGIPTISERTALFYNTEIFRKYGISKVPDTYEELEECCRKLYDPSKGQYAIALRGEGNSAVTQFAPFLRGFGGDFVKDGKASINTPEAMAAFRFYGKLAREYGAPGAANMIWSDSLNVFIQGKAAMYIDGDVHYAETLDPDISVIADKVGYSIFPEGPKGRTPTSIISWVIGIGSGSEKKEAAWEFIKWATSKDVDRMLAVKGNSSTRTSTWESPEGKSVYPEGLVSVINETNKIGNPIDRPFLIAGGEARSIVAEVLSAAVEGKANLQQIADDANVRLQRLADKEQ